MSESLDVAVMGAGFAGLAVAHRLALDGIHNVGIFERGDGVGGTWRANTYPGAACDVPSHLYSLSFAPNPNWSSAFATQPEILAYIEDCYDRFDLRRKVLTNTTIRSLRWREESSLWELLDSEGVAQEARFVVSAIGLFHTPKYPDIAGLNDFQGAAFHSARWDHTHDLAGERVAVIGTGASSIQIVPAIAEAAGHLDVYQRTAPWILPRQNAPYTPEQQGNFANHPESARQHREDLREIFEQNTSFRTHDPLAPVLAETSLDYLARKVADPVLREQLTPTHPFGCTRTLISSDYYPALQRDDVRLITEPITSISETGIQTADGTHRPVDTIVLCTGFRATDFLRGVQVVGRRAHDLHGKWDGLPRAYHGIAVPGFPNFFMMYGPNTNQGGNSILLMLEAQAEFIARAIEATEDSGAAWLDVTDEAMDQYDRELREDLAGTIWSGGCNTYFHSATGDVVTQLPHTTSWYAKATAQIDRAHFNFGDTTCSTS